MGIFRTYLVPAAVFQSVIFGGAYGTGREVVEYITRFGGVDGLLALLACALAFAICLALSFDLARSSGSYDYRTFFKQLIGPGWVVFEATFLAAVVLVLAVNLSAAAALLADHWYIPPTTTRGLLLVLVVALIALGRNVVQLCMVLCSVCLLTLLLLYMGASFAHFADAISLNMTSQSSGAQALASGLQYALYNLLAVPALLFCARSVGNRREAWLAGACAGLFGMLPALLFHCTFIAYYPDIIPEPLPVYVMMSALGMPGLMTMYIVVLVAMIVCTMTGLLLGFNERIDHWWLESHPQEPPRWLNALLSCSLIMLSLLCAEIGFVDLIAEGYGTLAWVVLAIFVIPLLGRAVLQARGSLTG